MRRREIVIFTAENGTDNVGEASTLRLTFLGREVRGGKYYPTELGANVPFLVRWPGVVKAGTVTRALEELRNSEPGRWSFSSELPRHGTCNPG